MARTNPLGTLGPYALHRRLAVGGMAEVYSATMHGTDGFEKPVALKRIHAHLSEDDQFVAMLVAEAKLCGSLHHKNIVQTFDLDRVEGMHLLVMERVDGHDLGQLLGWLRQTGTRLPWAVAAYVVGAVCRGLGYAHRLVDVDGELLGIVHRDVSPQNVLLSFAGEVKVADFGIAKSVERVSEPEAGVIKGKYFYMSPEQAWGDPLGPATDVFSAGVVLWELLTGEPLRCGKTVTELLDEVRDQRVPPPSDVVSSVPPAFDAIVGRATAPDPTARYSSADAMADALDDVAIGLDQDPAASLRAILAKVVPSPAPEVLVAVPRTRSRATDPAPERVTPASATVRFSLDDGEPTVAGWRSPAARGRSTLGWLVVAATLSLAVVGVWLLERWR